mmetsp:Transcript_11959/g.22962  ORF Transcript_11959/g.22962 Transcript_11959/m.22962 type:complete len:410 (-) Transcript_11959:20-1249(-)
MCVHAGRRRCHPHAPVCARMHSSACRCRCGLGSSHVLDGRGPGGRSPRRVLKPSRCGGRCRGVSGHICLKLHSPREDSLRGGHRHRLLLRLCGDGRRDLHGLLLLWRLGDSLLWRFGGSGGRDLQRVHTFQLGLFLFVLRFLLLRRFVRLRLLLLLTAVYHGGGCGCRLVDALLLLLLCFSRRCCSCCGIRSLGENPVLAGHRGSVGVGKGPRGGGDLHSRERAHRFVSESVEPWMFSDLLEGHPGVGIFVQQSVDQAPHSSRKDDLRSWNAPRDHHCLEVPHGFPSIKRKKTDEESCQHNSAPPDVRLLRVVPPPLEDLWGLVLLCSALGHQQWVRLIGICNPEVYQFDVVFPVEENVLQLDVPVRHFAVMQVLDCVNQLHEILVGSPLVQRAALGNEVEERPSRDVL